VSAFTRLYGLRTRIATSRLRCLRACCLCMCCLAQWMIVYKKKRVEYETLQKRIMLEQKENELYRQQIQGLKTDEKAVEKEAREQLHYARPGEYVYVPSAAANPGRQ